MLSRKLISYVFLVMGLSLLIGSSSLQMITAAQGQDSTRVIVGLKVPFQPEGSIASAQGVTAQRSTIQQAQAQVLASVPNADATTVVNFKTIPYMAVTVDAAGLQALKSSGQIASVQPDTVLSLFLDNSTVLTGADTAWNMGYDGSGQTVAIIDSGVDKYHWFFNGRVVAEACFSTNGTMNNVTYTSNCPNGQQEQMGAGAGINCPLSLDGCYHGTHVAGIAAGKGSSFSGIARNANIIAVQASVAGSCNAVGGKCLGLLFSNVIQGLEYVYSLRNTYNISAVNMSLGATANPYTGNCDADNQAIKAAVDTLLSANIAVIAASGNDGYTDQISRPACLSNVISVGATSADPYTTDRFARFSNSSPELDLLAPGANIMSAIPDAAFENLSGTSMAAPHVAGAWAVLRQVSPGASVASLLNTLKNSGVSLTDPRNNIVTPRIQIDAAVLSLTGGTYPAPANDNFANSTLFNPTYNNRFMTRSATSEPGLNLPALSANCGGGAIDKDVWFRYVASGTQDIVLSSEGSSFDTVLAVWTNVPAAPTLAGCSDDVWDSDKQSRLTLSTTPNTTYYIQVGGRNNVGGLLRFGALFPIDHDLIANAKVIGSVPYGDAVNTEQTTQDGNDPVATNCSDYFINNPTPWNTVWYRYTPAQDEKVVFNTFGSNFNTLISLWKGQPGNLTEVACHDDVSYVPVGSDNVNDMVSFIQTTLTGGETYYLMAGGKDAFFTNNPKGELKVDVQTWYIDPSVATPAQIGPNDGASVETTPPTLTWHGVAGATGYDVQIGTTNPPATTLIRVNGTSYKPLSLQTSTYYWRVRAVNSLPTSAWSSIRQFAFSGFNNSLTDAPPINYFATNTLTLTWGRVSWAAVYEIQVAKNQQFTNPVYSNTGVAGVQLTLDSLEPAIYYWRVRAKRADGYAGLWSPTDSFVIVAP